MWANVCVCMCMLALHVQVFPYASYDFTFTFCYFLFAFCFTFVHFLQTEETRTITHFQYTDWPDFGIPETPNDFLMFLQEVRDSGVLSPDVGPCVVHCRYAHMCMLHLSVHTVCGIRCTYICTYCTCALQNMCMY